VSDLIVASRGATDDKFISGFTITYMTQSESEELQIQGLFAIKLYCAEKYRAAHHKQNPLITYLHILKQTR